jgi:hypothetical protein
MRRLLAISMLLLLIARAGAETPAEARAKIVAPFLDPQTIAVARIDVTKVDPDALVKRVSALTKLDEAVLAKEAKALGEFKKKFMDAGGKEIYLVISLADLPESCLLVVPFKEEKPIPELLRQVVMLGIERRGDAVGIGTEATLKRLRDLKPDPRLDLAKAFAALGDNADADLVVLPPADLRRALDETMPKLPAEVGGGSSKVLTDGLRWAAARLKLAPKAEFEIIVQTKDADTASTLRDITRRALEQMVKHDDLKQWLPKGDKLVEFLAPTVNGDRLGLKVTEEQLLAAELLGGVIAARLRAADRVRSTNNLRQIGLAMHIYHDTHGVFPPAASFTKDGKPLLSWRVHILPFIEQDQLYKEFKLDEPWDSEHNKKLIAKMPAIFRTPGGKERAGFTSYLGIAGKDAMFTGEAKGLAIKDVADGTSNTIWVVEVADDHTVEWTKPVDLKFAADKPLAGLRAAFNALFVDGSVRYFSKTPEAKVMKALFTRNGGEVVDVP